MKYKNYYRILGLSGPKATAEEIKTAYRKLAKRYHPDCNPGNREAAEKFKDVSEAYQILADETSRRKYNRRYYAYSFKDGISVEQMKSRIDTSGMTDFVETFLGKVEPKQKDRKKEEAKQGASKESILNLTLEEGFAGVSKRVAFRKDTNHQNVIDVKIPKGIVNGGKIRIKGLGEASKQGGPAGDLFLKIQFLEHPIFRLVKENLEMDLPITPSEAVLGCKITVKGLEEDVTLSVPAGTVSGERICLPEQGYYDEKGNRGNLVANVQIVVPKEVSKEERMLYEKLQKISTYEPRKTKEKEQTYHGREK